MLKSYIYNWKWSFANLGGITKCFLLMLFKCEDFPFLPFCHLNLLFVFFWTGQNEPFLNSFDSCFWIKFFFLLPKHQTSSPGNTRGWLLAAKDELYILSSRWSLNPHPAAKLISQYTSSVPVDRIANNYILPKSFPVHLAAKHIVIQ